MTELRIETWEMPAADLGPENPLPPLAALGELHTPGDARDVPKEMLQNMAYGHVPNILPYTVQDGYTRGLRPRSFRVAVLENDHLRATFLLEFGGRLWSLIHKASGRELLSVNPVFQPANLAMRNAWFSGGVEWNIGTIGHSPFTCAPMFAARIESLDGMPILRLYEWERIRQVPFQIDAYLPDASPVLFVRVRILNPHEHETAMYWWSNIAVPETRTTRVITPADSAYRFGYRKTGLMRIPVPRFEGTDFTYSTNSKRAADYFFHIPDQTRRWIAALDEKGRGLIQVSTDRLIGRKLFLWGIGAGGKKWQKFLSPTGQSYIEIQAGLARTQMEHLPMPAGAEWAWLEAYGLMEADPDIIHGDDWPRARHSVEDALQALIPRADLDAEFERSAGFADTPPSELIQRGSGWGALERIRREASGEPAFCSEGLVFDDASLGAQQSPWLHLLESGALPVLEPTTPPHGFMVQGAWRKRLESTVEGHSTWAGWFHLGVMRHYAGDHAGARQAWEESLKLADTPWATRNLAMLAWSEEEFETAARLFVRACRLAPSISALAVECGRCLIEAQRPQEWLDLLGELPPAVQALGRIRLLEAQAALAVRDFARAERLFSDRVVISDLREGERALSDLWFDLHTQRLSAAENLPIDDALRARVREEFPLPEHFDFRM